MRKTTLAWIAGLVLLSGLVYWIALRTEWVDTTVPMPPTGEAAENPFYAAQRLVEALGARGVRDRQLVVPPAGAVVVVSAWHWDLTEARRSALERWVESGGRLVVAGALAGGADKFARWAQVSRRVRPPVAEPSGGSEPDDGCHDLREESPGAAAAGVHPGRYVVCGVAAGSFLTASGKPLWLLRDDLDVQAVRVAVGQGSVTVINARSFQFRTLLEGDHGRLLVAATQLRRGDEVHFLTEDDHPSMLALTWRLGGPAIVLGLAAIGLALWRGSARFGPLAAAQQAARRSLAEQIRGTGQFALRHGGGESLHDAAVRALSEAAARRIPGYLRMSPGDRAAALATVTGFERTAFTDAVHHAGLRSAGELRATLAFLETARREILRDPRGTSGSRVVTNGTV